MLLIMETEMRDAAVTYRAVWEIHFSKGRATMDHFC